MRPTLSLQSHIKSRKGTWHTLLRAKRWHPFSWGRVEGVYSFEGGMDRGQIVRICVFCWNRTYENIENLCHLWKKYSEAMYTSYMCTYCSSTITYHLCPKKMTSGTKLSRTFHLSLTRCMQFKQKSLAHFGDIWL